MEQLNLREVERVDRHKGAVVVVDVDAAGKTLDGAVVGGRHFVAGAIGEDEHERFERTGGEALQNLGDDDGGRIEVGHGGNGGTMGD